MPLLTVIVTLIITGVLLYLINSFIPMDGKVKQLLNITVVIVLILWLLQVFGIIGNLSSVHVPQVR